jgi:hypothetical protein
MHSIKISFIGGSRPDVLQQATVQIIPNADCNAQYNGKITNQQLCASAPGKDTCQVNSRLYIIQTCKTRHLRKWYFVYTYPLY